MARPRKLPDGMRLRGRVYHADFCAGGRRIRKRLSTNLKAATEILNDLRARADRADFNLLDNDYPLDRCPRCNALATSWVFIGKGMFFCSACHAESTGEADPANLRPEAVKALMQAGQEKV